MTLVLPADESLYQTRRGTDRSDLASVWPVLRAIRHCVLSELSGRANRRRLGLAGDLFDLSGEPLM
ncbi:MAG: hypothetical protein ABWY29_04700 [Blastococcus sp.]